MIELAKHIEILLLDNDCVIVPEFGGFMAHHVNSVYDEEDGLFLPPRRTLGFNSQLYINDSLLAQSYVEAYDISYPDAMNRIESEVREMRQIIALEGYYELPDIGVIRVNEDNNYEFEPCPSGILTPSIYALDSFEMPLLNTVATQAEVYEEKAQEAKPVARKMKAKKKWGNVIKFPKGMREETNASVSENAGNEADNAPKHTATILSIDSGLYMNIAAVAVLLIVFVFSSMPFGEAVPTVVQQCSMDSNILSTIMPQSKVVAPEKIEVVKVVNNAVVNTERTASEDSVLEVKRAEKKEQYVIVLASKVAKSNGEALAERLKKDGLKDARVLERANGNKVVCGAYDSEAEAYVASDKLRDKSSQYRDVWVMKVN